jgi:hypothetical protein
MKHLTAYQHKQIAARYLAQMNSAYSTAKNDALAAKAQKHIQAYIDLAGQLPE